MASHVAHAADDEVDFALQSVRGDRFVDRLPRLPGTRTGSANLSQVGVAQQQMGGRRHNRDISGSSGSGGQRGGGIGLGPSWNSQLQSQGLAGRGFTGREFSHSHMSHPKYWELLRSNRISH